TSGITLRRNIVRHSRLPMSAGKNASGTTMPIGRVRKAAIAHRQPAHTESDSDRRIALTYQYRAIVEKLTNGTSVMNEKESAKNGGSNASASAPRRAVLRRHSNSRSVRYTAQQPNTARATVDPRRTTNEKPARRANRA